MMYPGVGTMGSSQHDSFIRAAPVLVAAVQSPNLSLGWLIDLFDLIACVRIALFHDDSKGDFCSPITEVSRQSQDNGLSRGNSYYIHNECDC